MIDITDEDARSLERDGAIVLRQALKSAELATALKAYEWSLSHPGPSAMHHYAGTPEEFYVDVQNRQNWPIYRELFKSIPVGNILAGLWGTPNIWMFNEQIFLKGGLDSEAASRRTAWHQDQAYGSYAGSQLAVMWISFDPVKAEDSLEFIPGSHHGPLYNPSAFNPADDTIPVFDEGLMPRLPDIEASRDQWNIVSWDIEPGDILVFHHGTLHGGGGTKPGSRRRTLTMRFFGPDAQRTADRAVARSNAADGVKASRLDDSYAMIDPLSPGEPLWHNPDFPKVPLLMTI